MSILSLTLMVTLYIILHQKCQPDNNNFYNTKIYYVYIKQTNIKIIILLKCPKVYLRFLEYVISQKYQS